MKKVNQFPIGPEWKCRLINVTGDLLDDEGKKKSEHLELWCRDPVECVKELIGNPFFKEYMFWSAFTRTTMERSEFTTKCGLVTGGGRPKYDSLRVKRKKN